MNPFGKGWAKHLPLYGLLPTLFIFILVGFGPSMATFVISLTNYSGIPGSAWHWIGLQNYHDFLYASNSRDKIDSLQKTVVFAFFVTVIQNLAGLILASLLNRKLRGTTFFRTTIFLPVVLGVTVCGLAWTLIFNPIYGPAIKLWNLFGANSSFLGDPKLALPIVIFVQIWMYVGFSLILYLAGLQSVPEDLYEAGYMDGATGWQSFRYVTLPLLAPIVTVNTLLALIGSLQAFDTVLVLTGGDNDNTRVMGLLIFQTAFGGQGGTVIERNLGFASALTVVQFFYVLVVTIIAQYFLRRREVQT